MKKLTILAAFLLALSSCTKEVPVPDSDSGPAYYPDPNSGSCDPNAGPADPDDPYNDPGDYSNDNGGDYSGDDGDNSGDDGSDDSGDDGGDRYKVHRHHSTAGMATADHNRTPARSTAHQLID